MARSWPAKAPTEVVERRWLVPLAACDRISSVSAVASGVTVSSEDHALGEAVLVLSSGDVGTTGSVTVTVSTTEGNAHVETFLIPISATAQQFTYTARDVCYFALRKIVGNGEDPSAEEATDALERLNDLAALWRLEGADVGLAAPLSLGDVLTIRDEFVSALKFNLRVACHDHYGEAISPYDAGMADATKRAVMNATFAPDDLGMPATLAVRPRNVADLF